MRGLVWVSCHLCCHLLRSGFRDHVVKARKHRKYLDVERRQNEIRVFLSVVAAVKSDLLDVT